MRKYADMKRGMSLIELLITFVVVILLMGALFWMLLAGKTMWQASVTRSAGRQDVQTASWRIALDLRDSKFDTITNNTSGTPSAFSFLSAYNSGGNFVTDNSGEVSWQKYIIYYIPTGTTRLLKKDVYGSFSGALTLPQLTGYCNGAGSLISPSVTSMQLTNVGSNSATLSLTVENTSKHGTVDRQTKQINIMIRN